MNTVLQISIIIIKLQLFTKINNKVLLDNKHSLYIYGLTIIKIFLNSFTKNKTNQSFTDYLLTKLFGGNQ